ncbi:MAG: DUF4157 domain-containing protein [Anaerolineaceae bacterium]|nr:DUF4157 domain-containing protein [Anaerolineaceae bacterium]
MILAKFYQEKLSYSTRNLLSRQTASHRFKPDRNLLDIHNVLRSSGKPLDSATRTSMEAIFNHDFSQVRIHSDENAATSAMTLNALAYTVGRNVVFGTGQYNPSSPQGRRLLAHELTHVMQQGGASYQPGTLLRMDPPGSAFERQAEAVAAVPVQAGPLSAKHMSGGLSIQRAVQAPGSAGAGGKTVTNDACAGWFVDHQSLTKRAAEHYVDSELKGKRGSVERIVCDLFDPKSGAYACTNYFSDGTPIRVIVRKDAIIVSVAPIVTMYPPPDRPLCWYDYKCIGPSRHLVLTKRKCHSAKTTGGSPSGSSRTSPNP